MRPLIPRKQTQDGLAPSWPKGRLIEEITGWIAHIFVLFPPLVAIGTIFFGENPFEEWRGRLAMMVWGFALGTIWAALRRDALRAALAAVMGNFAMIAVAILAVMLLNMRNGESLSGSEGMLVYGLGTLTLFALWFAFREIRAEAARRKDGAFEAV